MLNYQHVCWIVHSYLQSHRLVHVPIRSAAVIFWSDSSDKKPENFFATHDKSWNGRALYDKTSCFFSTLSFCVHLANYKYHELLSCKLIKVCVYSYCWDVAKISLLESAVFCRHALEALWRSQWLVCTGASSLVYALVWHHGAIYLSGCVYSLHTRHSRCTLIVCLRALYGCLATIPSQCAERG